MKTLKTTADKTETSVELDLFEGRRLKPAVKERIREEVGQYLVEQTLAYMHDSKSPVQGGAFKASLSPLYKKHKLKEVGHGEADLEFSGVMKDELDFKPTKNGIDFGVFGERAGAADGHNNFSGKSKLPLRKFLPADGEKYKAPIQKEVDRIISDIIAEESSFKKSQFKGIETRSQLYEALVYIFGPMSRAELKSLVYRNEDLYDILVELGIVGLL